MMTDHGNEVDYEDVDDDDGGEELDVWCLTRDAVKCERLIDELFSVNYNCDHYHFIW